MKKSFFSYQPNNNSRNSRNTKKTRKYLNTPTQEFIHPLTIPPPSIKNKSMKVKGHTYYLNNNTLTKKNQDELFYKVQPIYFDEEIFDEIDRDNKVNLLFTWVMGFTKKQNKTNKLIYDPKNIHLWSKKVRSPAEITTKHIDIVRQSFKLKNNEIKELLYAGEMKIFKEETREGSFEYTILLNFLSGSFMANISNQIKTHKKQVEDCVRSVIERIGKKRKINLYIFEETENTLIKNTNFTENNIEKYYTNLLSSGVKFLNNVKKTNTKNQRGILNNSFFL